MLFPVLNEDSKFISEGPWWESCVAWLYDNRLAGFAVEDITPDWYLVVRPDAPWNHDKDYVRQAIPYNWVPVGEIWQRK